MKSPPCNICAYLLEYAHTSTLTNWREWGDNEVPTSQGSQTRRLATIREILEQEPVASQLELRNRLAARGFAVTQSSVSRDLKELAIEKVDGRYVLGTHLERRPSSIDEPRDEPRDVINSITRVRTAGPNLLVIHTPPGRAASVAFTIDSARWPEVVGTVAGDDTVFLATENRRQQARMERRFETYRTGPGRTRDRFGKRE